MKAMRLHEITEINKNHEPLTYEEIPVPEPGNDE